MENITLKAKQITEQGLTYCVTELVLELAGNAQYTDDLIDYIDNDYIFEYWIVDYVLASKLRDKNEIVFDFLGMTIWARQSTGQVAYVDDVIQEIAKDILEDEELDYLDNQINKLDKTTTKYRLCALTMRRIKKIRDDREKFIAIRELKEALADNSIQII